MKNEKSLLAFLTGHLARFCLTVLLISGHLNQALSQPAHPFEIELDSITETLELDRNWLFHKGDDPDWASPDFDDTGWDTLSTRLDLDRISPEIFDSIGWFRLHLKIDSTLYHKAFALSMDQMGVSEIFFNGNKIQTSGTFEMIQPLKKLDND